MKQFLLSAVCIVSLYSFSQAQNDKYVKAMEQRIAEMNKAATPENWLETANGFERIAEAEKTQWLAYYYAAYSHIMRGYMLSSGKQGQDFSALTDPEADKAEALLAKAEALKKDNSEIMVLKKMIATLRLSADPMNRWQTQLPLATEAMNAAKKLDPDNPRITLLEGQDKFFTPEEYGGNKAEGKQLLEEAVKKLEAQKPASTIDPTWGLSQAKYFLSQMNK